LFVRRFASVGDLSRDGQCVERKGSMRQPWREILTIHKLHDERPHTPREVAGIIEDAGSWKDYYSKTPIWRPI
jgi:hypothetical protein